MCLWAWHVQSQMATDKKEVHLDWLTKPKGRGGKNSANLDSVQAKVKFPKSKVYYCIEGSGHV